MHRETSEIVLSLEMDQESSRIALVYVCVCMGDVGGLGCRIVLLHSILYILYSMRDGGFHGLCVHRDGWRIYNI